MSGLKQKIKAVAIGASVITLVVGGIIGGIIEGGTTASAYSGDWSSYTDLGDYIVKTDEEGAMPALTKDQLKAAIDKSYTGEEHDNYIAELDTFISVQNKYKVNAAFIVAVAKKESTGGTNWAYIDKNSHNWFSIQINSKYNGSSNKSCSGGGYTWCWYDSYKEATEKFGEYISDNDSYYFKVGEITVDDISPHFAGVEWANKVKEYLDTIYASIGLETNTDSSTVSGNTFKNNKGRTFSLFNQNNYSDDYGGNSIAGCGCGLTSLSMCISGYGNKVDPPSVAKKCLSKFPGQYTWRDGFGTAGDGHVFKNYLSVYGLTGQSYGGYDKEAIKKHLQNGNPVILNIQNGTVWNAYYSAHYITVLGSRNGGKEVYLGDPAGQYGWITLNQIGGCIGYFLVQSK